MWWQARYFAWNHSTEWDWATCLTANKHGFDNHQQDLCLPFCSIFAHSCSLRVAMLFNCCSVQPAEVILSPRPWLWKLSIPLKWSNGFSWCVPFRVRPSRRPWFCSWSSCFLGGLVTSLRNTAQTSVMFYTHFMLFIASNKWTCATVQYSQINTQTTMAFGMNLGWHCSYRVCMQMGVLCGLGCV